MEAYAKALLVAIPFFVVLMAVEIIVGAVKGKQTYTALDTVSSISSGLTNLVKDSLGLILVLISYPFLVEHLAVFNLTNSIALGALAFIALDLAGYWNHRLSHKVNLFWNFHVIHHSSEEYNLACALRQPVSNLLGYFALFLIPAAILGIPEATIAVLAPVHLFLQFWYHTKHIGKLGWLEYVLVTPSQHRVHHAINKEYLDKNLAPIFSIWDRMFGTFQEELDDVPAVYGVLKPAHTWNPFIINFQHVWLLVKDAWRTRSVLDKLRIWFMPTGWRPADVAEKYPLEIISDPKQQVKYRTNHSSTFSAYAVIQMLCTLGLLLLMFAYYGDLSSAQLLSIGAAVALSIFGYTSLMDKRKWAGIFEILRAGLGVVLVLASPQILGLDIFPNELTVVFLAYLAVTFTLTVYFSFLDNGFYNAASQTS
ncbi:MAG: sterol desaturase family protein [Flavobacteriales bacterium]